MRKRTKFRAELAIWVAVLAFVLSAAAQEESPPKVDHILLEVGDLKKSIAFYHDLLGLKIKSQKGDFVTMESENVGVFLWSKRWDWEGPRNKDERQGLGMYPHFKVKNVSAV